MTQLRPLINCDTSNATLGFAAHVDQDAIATTPLDFLLAIGEVSLLRNSVPAAFHPLASHWAIARYLWTFLPPQVTGPNPVLRLSQYARAASGRARGLWSEAVAFGVADHLLEASLGVGEVATPLLDVDDRWLDWLVATGAVIKNPTAQPNHRPDYLALRATPGGPSEVVVIECKGSKSAQKAGAGVLAGGLNEAKSVLAGSLPVRRWVVAANCPRNNQGTWHPQAVEIADGMPWLGAPTIVDAVAVAFEERAGRQALRAVGNLPATETQTAQDGTVYRGRTLRIAFGPESLSIFLGVDDEQHAAVVAADFDAVRARRTAHREATADSRRTFIRETGAPAARSSRGMLLAITNE